MTTKKTPKPAPKAKAKVKVPLTKVKVPLTDAQKRDKLLGKELGPDATKVGDALGRKFFGDNSLGRVADTRSAETQGQIDQYRGIADQYGLNSPTRRSGDVSDYLNKLRAGLEAYSSPELLAQKEQAQRGIDQQYQTSAAQNTKAQARSGVRGASATAQQQNLERSRIGEQQNLEQDLLVKNADEKQKRLLAYGGQLGGIENDEYTRMMTSLGKYGEATRNADTDTLGRQKFNLDQQAAEKAGQAASYYGGIDMMNNQDYQKRAQGYQNEMMDFARQQMKRGRSTTAAGFMQAAGSLFGNNGSSSSGA